MAREDDERFEDLVTVGLLRELVELARLISARPLWPAEVCEALAILGGDQDVKRLLDLAFLERVIHGAAQQRADVARQLGPDPAQAQRNAPVERE